MSQYHSSSGNPKRDYRYQKKFKKLQKKAQKRSK